MMQASKPNVQLMARCLFSHSTGKVVYENYSKYYTDTKKKKLFN